MTNQTLEGRQDYELYIKREMKNFLKKHNAPKSVKLMEEIIMQAFDNGIRLGHGKKIEVLLYEHD